MKAIAIDDGSPGRVMAGLALAVVLLLLPACAGEGENGPDAGGDLPAAARPMGSELQALVDRGNAAHRAGSYEEAMETYEEAMELDPDHPIPQFGALMAAMALGDTALVESLSAKLETSAPDLLGMLNPDGSMGGMPADPHAGGQGAMPGMPPVGDSGVVGLPPGHPVIVPGAAPDTTRADTAGLR